MRYDSGGFYFSPLMKEHGVVSIFGTRLLGDAKEPGTIERTLLSFGFQYGGIIRPQQKHTTNIGEYPDCGEDPQNTDGLITKESKIALTIVTADCVPILFYNASTRHIGIAHSGWLGTLKGMPHTMTRKLDTLGSNDYLHAAIGPAIGACCLELHQETYEEFRDTFRRYGSSYLREAEGKYYLNATELCRLQLIEGGVRPEHIDYVVSCTQCDRKRFFSHRRDRSDTRRMMNIIMKLS